MTASEIEVAPASDEKARKALGGILSHVFGAPVDQSEEYFEKIGHSNIRIATRGSEITGGLCMIPMGQWFGGRSVSMAGIAAVGVAPQHRSGGVATALMRSAVRELHASGFALSTLYAATQPVYRRVGYEHAGGYWKISMSPHMIDTRDRSLSLREIHDRDLDAVRSLYQRKAMANNGMLDRSEFIWGRMMASRRGEARGYLVERDEQPEGYVYIVQKESKTRTYDLWLNDFVALTPDAAARILSFIADHRSMTDTVEWIGSPMDPALNLLVEQKFEVKLNDVWMTRVVNVIRALEDRGYGAGLDATLDLEVYGDDVLPEENNGRYTLTVKNGRGSVERGAGDGRLRAHVNGLASLYTGHLSAFTGRSAGRLQCDDETAALATSIFAGPAPWLADSF